MKTLKFGCFIILLFVSLNAISAQSGTYKTSTDNLVKLKIPAGWTEMKLNEGAVLQYGNEDLGVYMLVINDPKADINGWNIKKHSFITLAKLLEGVASPEIEGPVYLTANGFKGVQYSIKGAVGDQLIMYLHTTFETEQTFAQLLVWTIPSQYEKNKKSMNEVINSFISAK
jgi:hypothetical protein